MNREMLRRITCEDESPTGKMTLLKRMPKMSKMPMSSVGKKVGPLTPFDVDDAVATVDDYDLRVVQKGSLCKACCAIRLR